MLFSSISFLYYFLPITVLLYFAAPNRARTTVLLIASLIFYGWGEPRYLLLMTVTILYGYGFGLLLERHRTIPVLTLALAGPIGFLLFFKYADFLLGTLALPLLRIALFTVPAPQLYEAIARFQSPKISYESLRY